MIIDGKKQARARFMLAAATIERDARLSELTDEEIDRLIKALSREEQVRVEEGWRPMSEAPRDGSYILAIVAPNRGRHLEHQAGRMFAIKHEGMTEPSGFDMGWAVYPGFGGASDHDFACWTRLPAPPSLRASGHEGGGNG